MRWEYWKELQEVLTGSRWTLDQGEGLVEDLPDCIHLGVVELGQTRDGIPLRVGRLDRLLRLDLVTEESVVQEGRHTRLVNRKRLGSGERFEGGEV